MSKLWDKGTSVDKLIEEFTIGRDKELDVYLAPFDVLGSIAHITMLQSINLLTKDELSALVAELRNIYAEIEEGNFTIEEGVEDVHSQVEMILTERVGEAGKKIHSARSRNDQVLVDLKLFTRAKLKDIVEQTESMFKMFIGLSNKHKDVLIPGYTHLQVAMPSSFGLWFGAYAESLADDLHMLLAAFNISNQNPLGSAAGYGSSFPINRKMTTELLGFSNLSYNVVYAQMGRGKTEKAVAMALGQLASTVSKFAADACMFMSQNFGFISLPAEYTTGSSIMPHKKNPDVFELTRAKCNKLQSLATELIMISNNLTSGYFRDYQILKESYIESFDMLSDCMNVILEVASKIEVKKDVLKAKMYKYVFSVEEVNNAVIAGVPFRDAYKKIGLEIEAGNFNPSTEIKHTHEGSVGNLCNAEIEHKFNKTLAQFEFAKMEEAKNNLLGR